VDEVESVSPQSKVQRRVSILLIQQIIKYLSLNQSKEKQVRGQRKGKESAKKQKQRHDTEVKDEEDSEGESVGEKGECSKS
jgi:hypothetical protein